MPAGVLRCIVVAINSRKASLVRGEKRIVCALGSK